MGMPVGMTKRNRKGHIVGTQGLTEAQSAFVTAYIRNGGNASAAAEEAGYGSPRQRAHELLQHPAIEKAIARNLRGRLARIFILSLDELERRLEREPDEMNVKELRQLLYGAADRLMPAPKAEEEQKVSDLDDASIEDLEGMLAEAKRQASDAARIIDVAPDGATDDA